MADLSNLFTGALSSGAALGLGSSIAGDLERSGQQQQQMLQDISQDVRGSLEFKPFTVTTGAGSNIATDSSGGYGVNLSPQEQALQDQSLFGAGQFLGAGQQSDPALAQQREMLNSLFGGAASQINPDISAVTQDIFNQMQGIVAPEQERQRLALEERLFSQGRSGVATSAYGGTPEQLALEKAIQEQTSANAFSARGQAMSEQDRLFNQLGGLSQQGLGLAQGTQGLQAGNVGLGQNFLNAAYSPQQQALQALGAGTQLANIGSNLQNQAGVTQAQLAQSGAEGLIGSQQLGTELQGTILANLLSALTNQTNEDPSSSVFGGMGDWIANLLGRGGDEEDEESERYTIGVQS